MPKAGVWVRHQQHVRPLGWIQHWESYHLKWPDGKYLTLCKPWGLRHSYSTLPLQRDSRHRQPVTKRLCWVPVKLSVPQAVGWIWPTGHGVPPGLE